MSERRKVKVIGYAVCSLDAGPIWDHVERFHIYGVHHSHISKIRTSHKWKASS